MMLRDSKQMQVFSQLFSTLSIVINNWAYQQLHTIQAPLVA